MTTLLISLAAILFASLSALFWALSARIKFKFGFDMDQELNESMKKSSTLNGWAAAFTALAALCQSTSMFIDVYTKAGM